MEVAQFQVATGRALPNWDRVETFDDALKRGYERQRSFPRLAGLLVEHGCAVRDPGANVRSLFTAFRWAAGAGRATRLAGAVAVAPPDLVGRNVRATQIEFSNLKT
jgi:hypothetical protein